MKKKENTWKRALVLGLLLMCLCGLNAFAEGLSADNSLASLGIENGTVSPEFYYSTVEYTVTVAPGTSELILNPVCSNSYAEITGIEGTALDNGTGTVTITVMAQNGSYAVYTLHVEPDPTMAPETEEPETEPPTEPQTEAPQTEPPQTEAPQTEAPQTEDSATITFLNGQIDQFREKLDFSMKVIYGLIALAVILMFLTINLILKNRDLKEDLRDAEDHLDFQTNEFARKEKMMDTENYYAPVKQQEQTAGGRREPAAEAPAREEPVRVSGRGPDQAQAQGAPTQNEQKREPARNGQEPAASAGEAGAPNPDEEDVDVTMVEL